MIGILTHNNHTRPIAHSQEATVLRVSNSLISLHHLVHRLCRLALITNQNIKANPHRTRRSTQITAIHLKAAFNHPSLMRTARHQELPIMLPSSRGNPGGVMRM